MPIYDCGSPECDECQRAFGPDRTKAIANFRAREAYYAALNTGTADGLAPRRQAASGGGEQAEKASELAALIL